MNLINCIPMSGWPKYSLSNPCPVLFQVGSKVEQKLYQPAHLTGRLSPTVVDSTGMHLRTNGQCEESPSANRTSSDRQLQAHSPFRRGLLSNENWHIFLHCSISQDSSTCSETERSLLLLFLHLSLTLSSPQWVVGFIELWQNSELGHVQ